MSNTPIEITYNGDYHNVPKLTNLEINIKVLNGGIVNQNSDFTQVVFYGMPPAINTKYPVVTFVQNSQSLKFIGNINSFYASAYIHSYDLVIKGLITLPAPLPFEILLGIVGSGKTVSLAPGKRNLSFELPLEGIKTVDAESLIAKRIEEVKNK